MKEYRNGMKATEFTGKQVGVIFGKAKRQEIKVGNWVIRELYDMANFYGYDDNRSAEREERDILEIIETAFNGTNEELQNLINNFTEKTFALFGRKTQAKCDRTVLV